MDGHTSSPKATPGRRRNGRSNGRSAGQKAYASENDAPSHTASHHNIPQTPDKTGYVSTTPINGNHSQATSKQRGRNTQNKFKGRNLPLSPESGVLNDDSSSQRSPMSRQKISTAYAGATFHASPAPSALPIPSFLTKSASDSPGSFKPHGIIQEPSPPATDTDVPTPYRPSATQNHESPLDFMFRAHREERERHRQDNMPSPKFPAQLFDPTTSPSAATLSQNRRTFNRQSFNGMDTFELEGSPGKPLGPAFSTPYQDRIKAARTNVPNQLSKQEALKQVPATAAEDPTEALKNFLFGGMAPVAPGFQNPAPAPAPSNTATNVGSSTNNQVDRLVNGGPANIHAMENDLRRILKLDLVPESTSSEHQLFTR